METVFIDTFPISHQSTRNRHPPLSSSQSAPSLRQDTLPPFLKQTKTKQSKKKAKTTQLSTCNAMSNNAITTATLRDRFRISVKDEWLQACLQCLEERNRQQGHRGNLTDEGMHLPHSIIFVTTSKCDTKKNIYDTATLSLLHNLT